MIRSFTPLTPTSLMSMPDGVAAQAITRSFAFSTDSYPFGPGLEIKSVVPKMLGAPQIHSGRERTKFVIKPQTFNSEPKKFLRFLQFMNMFEMPHEIRSKGGYIRIETNEPHAPNVMRIIMDAMPGFADSNCRFEARMGGLPRSSDLSFRIYFKSIRPFFAIAQSGALLFSCGEDGSMSIAGENKCGIAIAAGLDFLARVSEMESTDPAWNFWHQEFTTKGSGKKGSDQLRARLDAKYNVIGEGLFETQFIPAGRKVDSLGMQDPNDDELKFPVLKLTQNRMLRSGNPLGQKFAVPIVDLVMAAAELLPAFPLYPIQAKKAKEFDRVPDKAKSELYSPLAYLLPGLSSSKLRTLCRDAMIDFLGELAQKNEAELLVNGFSPSQINVLKRILKKKGLRLGMNIEFERPKEPEYREPDVF